MNRRRQENGLNKTCLKKAVVVSCGAGNSYGHPHSEALAAFANVGAQVYRTDTEGTIIAYVDKAGALQMAVSRQEAA